MSAYNFEELMSHYGHEIAVVYYGKSEKDAQNVAIECSKCGEVLLDFDREDE
jgi:hypothetical protein